MITSSGTWLVSSGREEEFVRRWTEFLAWTRSAFAELGSAQLLRDDEEPRHFVSFATWKNAAALRAWRSRSEFAEHLWACRTLCDDFRGSSYAVASSI